MLNKLTKVLFVKGVSEQTHEIFVTKVCNI